MSKQEIIKGILAIVTERLSEIEKRRKFIVSNFKKQIEQKRIDEVRANLGINPKNT